MSKPVMIKYIAEKNNCTARTARGCIEIVNSAGKVIREIYESFNYNGRAFATEELFRINFTGWHDRVHKIGNPFESEADAAMALACVHYGEGLKNQTKYVHKITQQSQKYEVGKSDASSAMVTNIEHS